LIRVGLTGRSSESSGRRGGICAEGEYEDETESRVSHRGRLCRNTSHDSSGLSPRCADRCENELRGRVSDHAGGLEDGNVGPRSERCDYFSLAYVVFLYRFFPGPAYVKGLTFGLVLWLASQLLILPLIGAGLFSSQMGGIRASGTLLLGHLVYGVLLGSLAGSAIEGLSASKPRANYAA
jgi:hypothetical protein